MDLLDPDLVRMAMYVGLSVMSVLVLMLDVFVIMSRVSVDVLVAVVLVLVGVGGLVCVFVGHRAPFNGSWFGRGRLGRDLSGFQE